MHDEKKAKQNGEKVLPLNLPSFDMKLQGTPDQPTIFDVVRRKYVRLTPEEWVRQHFVHFLIEQKGFPLARFANEIQLTIGEKTLRADTVFYAKNGSPQIIIEYKAPTIPITERVFNQVLSYNLVLHVDYLIVSNGLQHVCCRIDYALQTCHFLQEIPSYSEL